jgi:hypothetical protein
MPPQIDARACPLGKDGSIIPDGTATKAIRESRSAVVHNRKLFSETSVTCALNGPDSVKIRCKLPYPLQCEVKVLQFAIDRVDALRHLRYAPSSTIKPAIEAQDLPRSLFTFGKLGLLAAITAPIGGPGGSARETHRRRDDG